MLIFLLIITTLAVIYLLLMLIYARGWAIQKDFEVPDTFMPATKITVIIPARNEETNILNCVQSILCNDYPAQLLEVIVMDDHSTDTTYDLVQSIGDDRVKAVRLADHLDQDVILTAYKKKAIETAIKLSSGELIITTDADCIVPGKWLMYHAACYEQQKPVMTVGPVDFMDSHSLVSLFQSIDFMSMQGITAAAHALKLGNMSNGANLAFSREAFIAVDGYKRIDHLASGDDFLLMMKMQQQFPRRIAYLRNAQAVVRTMPQPDWTGFFRQRIRWASKSGKYDDHRLTLILALVYLFNLSFLVVAVMAIWNSYWWNFLLWLFLLKVAVEFFYLLPVATFFHKRRQLIWFPLLQPLHILYIVAAGFMGFIGVYQWKGRTVR